MPNPTAVTLTSLITSVRQRADVENTQWVTDSELTSYINGSYAELYDIMVQKYGDNYFIKVPFAQITTDGTNDKYDLPSDFYKLVGVDLLLSNSPDNRIRLYKFETPNRNRYSIPNVQTFYGYNNLEYNILGGKIWFRPLPQGGQLIELIYVPKITYLVAGSDTMDGVSGWEEYVIIDAVMKVLVKEESDVSALMAQKAAILQRIEAAAENRNAGEPPKVVDSLYSNFFYPNGNGNPAGGFY